MSELYPISMTELFQACSDILDANLCPAHYADLTRQAVERLGYRIDRVDMERSKEDVREKMLLAGQYGAFYLGRPYCLAAKRHWFKGPQLELLQLDTVVIPGNATSGYEGAFDALMRHAHLIHKNPLASVATVVRARARGKVVEQHVVDLFALRWPGFYLPPDNARKYKRVCRHDFKLKIDRRIYEVDVTTKNALPAGKHVVDFHLFCQLVGPDVIWRGVAPGKLFATNPAPEQMLSPQRMVVWLNCKAKGFDYDLLASTAIKARAA
jgi:hypothetical protein